MFTTNNNIWSPPQDTFWRTLLWLIFCLLWFFLQHRHSAISNGLTCVHLDDLALYVWAPILGVYQSSNLTFTASQLHTTKVSWTRGVKCGCQWPLPCFLHPYSDQTHLELCLNFDLSYTPVKFRACNLHGCDAIAVRKSFHRLTDTWQNIHKSCDGCRYSTCHHILPSRNTRTGSQTENNSNRRNVVMAGNKAQTGLFHRRQFDMSK